MPLPYTLNGDTDSPNGDTDSPNGDTDRAHGLSQSHREKILRDYQTDGSNGPTVYLVGSSSEVSKGATTPPPTSNSDVTFVSTSPRDWSITHDNTNWKSTLKNTAAINFGVVGAFTATQIIVESPSDPCKMIICNYPKGDIKLSEVYSTVIHSGDFTYTLGG